MTDVDLLHDDVFAALERHGETKLAKRLRKRAARDAESLAPKSIVDKAMGAPVIGSDGKPRIAMAFLEQMTPLDLGDLKARDRALYHRSLAAVLDGPELVVR